MTDLLLRSDLASGLTMAVFKYGFPSFPGSMGMDAAKAVVLSALARVLPGKVPIAVGSLTVGQKSEILVGVLAAAEAAWKKHDPLQAALAFSACDALSLQVMAILGVSDGSMLGSV